MDIDTILAYKRAEPGAPLNWPKLHPAESVERSNISTGVYKGYRNKKAHKEDKAGMVESVSEFMLIKQLFAIESDSRLPGEITPEDEM